MHKDIREIMKEEHSETTEVSLGHRARFQQKLMEELHSTPIKRKRTSNLWWYAAASILVVALAITGYYRSLTTSLPLDPSPVQSSASEEYPISLGSISPELKTIESYYTNTINYELSKLELTQSNKELFDGYLSQLSDLTKEYKLLTKELNTKGVNNDIINALIGNLQLRVQLLKRMQKQLEEFKKPIQNEMQSI